MVNQHQNYYSQLMSTQSSSKGRFWFFLVFLVMTSSPSWRLSPCLHGEPVHHGDPETPQRQGAGAQRLAVPKWPGIAAKTWRARHFGNWKAIFSWATELGGAKWVQASRSIPAASFGGWKLKAELWRILIVLCDGWCLPCMQIWAILNPKTSQQRHFGGCVRSLRGHERLKGHGTNWYHLSGFPILFHPFPLAARMTQQHVPAGSTKVSLWRTRFFQPNWSYKRPWIEKWKGMWNQQPMGLSPSFPTQTIGAIMNYDSIIC